MLTTAISLLAATEAALAKNGGGNGGGNSGGHSAMSDRVSSSKSENHPQNENHAASESRESDKHADRHADKDDYKSSRHHKDDEDKDAEKDKKGCGYTQGCGVSAKDPAGNTGPAATTSNAPVAGPGAANTVHPIVNSNPTGAAPGTTPVAGPGAANTVHPIVSSNPTGDAPGTATVAGPGAANIVHPVISSPEAPANKVPAGSTAGVPTKSYGLGTVTVANGNGLITSNLSTGTAGLMVTSTSPGTITVSNGTNTVTMPGGSLFLSSGGAVISVGAAPGLQLNRHPNGDFTVVAAKPPAPPAPAPAQPVAGASKVPPGVTLGDDAKFVGKGLGATVTAAGATAAGVVMLPVAGLVGVLTKHPVATVKDFVSGYTGLVTHWIGGWF